MTELKQEYKLTYQPESDMIYHRPQLRRLHHVSERELVLLNFIRNQASRCAGDDQIEVSLKIQADWLAWQRVK